MGDAENFMHALRQVTLSELARGTSRSRSTWRSYKSGDRAVSLAATVELSEYLKERAQDLMTAALGCEREIQDRLREVLPPIKPFVCGDSLATYRFTGVEVDPAIVVGGPTASQFAPGLTGFGFQDGVLLAVGPEGPSDAGEQRFARTVFVHLAVASGWTTSVTASVLRGQPLPPEIAAWWPDPAPWWVFPTEELPSFPSWLPDYLRVALEASGFVSYETTGVRPSAPEAPATLTVAGSDEREMPSLAEAMGVFRGVGI